MSANLDIAIYNRLTGIETLTGAAATAQAALIALLATDPDTLAPAVYNSNLNDAQLTASGVKVPIYPCVTFNQKTGTRYSEIWNCGTIAERVYYNFEVWNDARTSLPAKRMSEYIDRLLDFGLGAVDTMPVTDGKIELIETGVPMDFYYDNNLHAWAGLVRYAFTSRRW